MVHRDISDDLCSLLNLTAAAGPIRLEKRPGWADTQASNLGPSVGQDDDSIGMIVLSVLQVGMCSGAQGSGRALCSALVPAAGGCD